MTLSRDDFQELIGKEYVKSVTPQIAKSMIDSGYGLIDVRDPEEFDEVHIPGSMLLPLFELHSRVRELDRDRSYVVYCHSGNRSAVAAMLLRQHNLDAVSLGGGIRDWPYETTDIYTEVQNG
jgi:rhodanese-related sulfurtransferase